MKSHFFLILNLAITTTIPAGATPLNTQHTTNNHSRQYFNDLAVRCSSGVHPNTLQAIARVESGFNPYAIGVVRGNLARQPRNLDEAVNAARMLHAQGRNFSMGLMQINRHNLNAYGLNYETVFDPCKNINAGAQILKSCFERAGGNGQEALQKAFSCYYSGNFRFGFRSDFQGQPPYVTKVVMAAMRNSPSQTIPTAENNHNIRQSSLIRASYVPEPSTQNSNQVISQPAMQITPNQTNAHTAQPETQTRPKQSWDIFGEL